MSLTPIDNPFIKYNSGGYTSTDESSSVITTPDVIDFSATTPDTTPSSTENVTTPSSVKPIPLVKPKAQTEEIKGLTVETTAKPTLDKQTMKWFHMTQAEWNTLSDEDKQEKTEIALKGIVDAYNKNQANLGSNKKLTYAGQVKLYRDRTAAGDYDQVKRVTGSVKSLKGKDQADALKVAYQYKDEGNRNIAEKKIADDYTEYDKENVLTAARETKNFSGNNQALAAGSAWLADNSLHKDLVHEYMSRDNEDVQNALADNVGNFGNDDNGDITDEGRQIQYDCYKEIIGSKYNSVVTTAAENIWTMDKDNQVPAAKDIYATNNTDAKDAVAEQFNYYDDGAKQDIKSIINNSDCDSAKGIYEDKYNNPVDESTPVDELDEGTGCEPESECEYTYDAQPDSNASDEIDVILASSGLLSQEQIEKTLSTVPETKKSEILKNCSGDLTVLKALLASNPSKDLMDEIIDYMNAGNLCDKDQNELMGMVAKSGVFKGTNSKLGIINPQLQKTYIEQLALEDLQDVNKDNLSALAKDAYDKRLNELKNKDQQPNKKFGLLTA